MSKDAKLRKTRETSEEEYVVRVFQDPGDIDAAAWDAQIEADAAAGKLDALAAEALAEYNAGSPGWQ